MVIYILHTDMDRSNKNFKNLMMLIAGEGALTLAGGNAKWCGHFGRQCDSFLGSRT